MLRIAQTLAGLSLVCSASVFAAEPVIAIKEEAALKNVTVKRSADSEKPAAYIVSGEVQLASNACFAEGLSARLVNEKQVDGSSHVVAYVTGYPKHPICIEIYWPVFAKVSLLVEGGTNLADRVYIENAESLGNDLPLSAFLAESDPISECDKPAYCTREYQPTICKLGDVQFYGSNRCQALLKAKEFACVNGLSFTAEEVECHPRTSVPY